MYGIVNKAIEDLIRANYGDDGWEKIKISSRVEIDFFLSNEPNPDEITYRLVEAISKHIGQSLPDVLTTFGEWWVLQTTTEKYGGLMAANSLREFLVNLPVFHNRVMLIYPKLSPTEFHVSNLAESSIHVHYMSKRKGFEPFVIGLLQGLGKLYTTPVLVETLQSSETGFDHEVVFKVSW